MIGYVTLGTKDIKKAAEFYDALLEGVGAKRVFDSEGFVAWSVGKNQPLLSVILPFNGEPSTAGNGTMIGLNADNPDMINKLHAKALDLGGTNEGDPGLRDGGYYCAYFRDLDGNKLNFVCEST